MQLIVLSLVVVRGVIVDDELAMIVIGVGWVIYVSAFDFTFTFTTIIVIVVVVVIFIGPYHCLIMMITSRG